MGLFSKLKSFMAGPKYRINREILLNYINETMQFSVEYDLCAVDEFHLAPCEDGAMDMS